MSVTEEASLTPITPLPVGNILRPQAERVDFMQEIHHQTATVDIDIPLYPVEKIGLDPGSSGMRHIVVAELALPNENNWSNHCAVVRSTDKKGNSTFYLYGLDVDKNTGAALANDMKPITIPSDGRALLIGRASNSDVSPDALWGEKDYPATVSKNHASLSLRDGELIIEDTSSNGTKVTGGNIVTSPAAEQSGDGYSAEHTKSADEIARIRGLLDEQGKFSGRYKITRDTEVGGGSPFTVDIRAWQAGGEAIVVDSSRPEIQAWYRHYLDSAIYLIGNQESKTGRKATERQVLQAIFDTVEKNMQYDLEYVDSMSKKKVDNNEKVRKVNLANYMIAQKGVCRHMALACAWLGGELKQRKYLTGKLTAEVNQHAKNGAHEWARYRAADGEVTILDVAQHHIGGTVTDYWDYRRDEEKIGIVAPPPERINPQEQIKGFRKLFRVIVEEFNN